MGFNNLTAPPSQQNMNNFENCISALSNINNGHNINPNAFYGNLNNLGLTAGFGINPLGINN
jgi:hypothetical protein